MPRCIVPLEEAVTSKKTAPVPKKGRSNNSNPFAPTPKKTVTKGPGAKALPKKMC